MFRSVPVGLSLVLGALLLPGCAQRSACVSGGAGGSLGTPAPTEMRAERGSLSSDLSALSSYAAVDRALGTPAAPSQYRVLRAEEVQCLAAANAPLAKLYTSESQAVLEGANGHNYCAAVTMSRLMVFRAVDERNKAAGTALELFYSLAEAEASRDILDRSLVEIDRAAANLDQLKQSGLKIPLDRSALQRQKLDWLDHSIELRSAAYRTQGQLQQICGLELNPSAAIWPQADLTVTVTPLDVPATIAEGLTHRADVGALRMLGGSVSADTLPAARSGMQALGPGMGASLAGRRLFGGDSGSDDEVQTRQAQVAQARTAAEQNTSREIAEAADNVASRLREIAVAKERWELWRQRVADLQQTREANGVTTFDINAAQLEMLRAESDMVHRVIAWKIAQAKLKQAQGLLAAECGYHLPDACR